MSINAQISFKNSLVSYQKIGLGDQIAVVFHGYGESGTHFKYLEEEAKFNNYTLFAIDLPFHGHTIWYEGLNCTTHDLDQIIKAIFLVEGLSGDDHFEIWGYSMGGRIALGYYQDYNFRISRIVLLASDGIYVNPWYWLSTQTSIGNLIFKKTMSHPSWFIGFLCVGYKLRLINKSIYKFASNYMDDAIIRDNLYKRWTCFRTIYSTKNKLIQLINSQQTPITGIYGEFDRIIPFSKVKKFWSAIKLNKKIIHLKDGHKLLQAKYARLLFKD